MRKHIQDSVVGLAKVCKGVLRSLEDLEMDCADFRRECGGGQLAQLSGMALDCMEEVVELMEKLEHEAEA